MTPLGCRRYDPSENASTILLRVEPLTCPATRIITPASAALPAPSQSVKSRAARIDEPAVALSFPDDFPFNRRSSEREAPMKPQAQPQAQAPVEAQTQAPAQAPRVRPVAPAGAQASAAAMTAVPPAPTPVFAETQVSPAPVATTSMTGPARPAAHAAVEAVYPRAQERRRSPRQTLVAKAVVRSESNQTTVATGFLSNISMLGVGFHTRRPLSIGEKFQLRLELGPMKWATRLRIVSCQSHDSGTFDVGAEFIGNDLIERVGRELAA